MLDTATNISLTVVVMANVVQKIHKAQSPNGATRQNWYCVCKVNADYGTAYNRDAIGLPWYQPLGCVRRGDKTIYTEYDAGGYEDNHAQVSDAAACSSSKKCICATHYADSIEPGEDYIPELDTGGDYAPHGPAVEYSQKGGSLHYVANDCITYEPDNYNFLIGSYQSYQSTEFTHG